MEISDSSGNYMILRQIRAYFAGAVCQCAVYSRTEQVIMFNEKVNGTLKLVGFSL